MMHPTAKMSHTAKIGLLVNIIFQIAISGMCLGFGHPTSALILVLLYVLIDWILILGFRRNQRWYLEQMAILDDLAGRLRSQQHDNGPDVA